MRLGLLYLELEKYSDAADNLEKSIEIDKKDYNKYFNLASAYNHLERWSDAASSAQSCIDLKKKFGGGWLELGLAEMGKRIRPEQKDILKKLEKIETGEKWLKEK